MKNKVLHIGKYYFPYKGGIENILKDLCEGIGQSYQTRVVCFNDKKENSKDTINDVDIYRFQRDFAISSQPISFSLLCHLRKHIKWADIIHIHSPNPLLELFTLILSGRKPLVSTHHSDIYKQKLLKLAYLPFWKAFRKRTNRFIVPTQNHIKYSTMINQSVEKTSIIPFGIKTEKFEKISHSFSTKQFGNYILFVGRLVEYKGLKYLIKAMKKIDLNLVIVGSGHLERNLKDQITENSLKEKVSILTNIQSQEELNKLYQDAFCFILPSISKNENFGIVQLEAMFFSLPIITTNLKSGVPDVGINGETTLIVEPKSSDEIASALQSLINNPQKKEILGTKAKELFNERYRYQTMIDKHIELYGNFLP